jgi:hypothetical protein
MAGCSAPPPSADLKSVPPNPCWLDWENPNGLVLMGGGEGESITAAPAAPPKSEGEPPPSSGAALGPLLKRLRIVNAMGGTG